MVYLAADCNFFQSDQRDKKLIHNWNKIVTDLDTVVSLGNFFSDIKSVDIARARDLLYELNGHIEIADYENFMDLISKNQLNEIGFLHVYTAHLYMPDSDYTVHIIPTTDCLEHFKGNFYGAAARSLTGNTKAYENNILSLTVDDWDMTPIEYMELPNLVKNLKKFYEGGGIVG